MEIFALLIVGGVAVAIAAAVQSRKTTLEAWRVAGERLGLTFDRPRLLERPVLHGTVDGCQVRVNTRTGGGDGSNTLTHYRVTYPRRLGFEMRLRRAGALSSVKSLLGAQDLRIGAQAFDDRVVVKGSDADKIRALLAPAVQTKVLRLLDTHTGAEIDEEGVRWESSGTEKDAARLTTVVRRLVDVATSLVPHGPDASREPMPPRSESTRTERRPPPSTREPKRAPREPGKPHAEANATPPPAGPARSGLSVAEVCRRLFESGVPPYEADRVFDAELRGRRVSWSGSLRWVARYPFDRVFGAGAGARATFDVYHVEHGYGERTAEAVVQVSPDDEPRLRRLAGETLPFEGVLKACDGFRRQIFLAAGSVGSEKE